MGYTDHIDSHRDFILHTLTDRMNLDIQKELDHCGTFSEIYDNFYNYDMTCKTYDFL